MDYHLTLILYVILFICSIIGYGILFSKVVNRELLKLNIGYIGIIGFFFICLISIFSSFFFSHNYLHNIILHTIGIISFLSSIKNLKKISEIKYLFFLIIILWI